MTQGTGHVFVSYSSADRRRVERLVTVLGDRGLDVRWDADLRPADDIDARLREMLESAAAVVVVWSATAARSADVTAEARLAFADTTYVPVTLDGFGVVPSDYRNVFTVDLSDWAGDPRDPHLAQLVEVLEKRVGPAASGSAPVPVTGPPPRPAPAAATVPAPPPLRPQPGVTELLGFALGTSAGTDVTPTHVLLAALLRVRRTTLDPTGLSGAASTALYLTLPAPAEPRIERALAAAGIGVIPARQSFEPEDGRVRSVLDAGRALVRRLGVTLFYSHHLVGAALAAAALPGPVLDELGVTGDQLRAAFRAGVARRWKSEPADVWDDLLGPLREFAVADETTELWSWAAAVRWARGRGPVDDTDIVLGALAAAHYEPVGGSAEALYGAIPSGDLDPGARLDAALAAAGARAEVDRSIGPSEVAPAPTAYRAVAIAVQVSGSPVVGRRHLLAAALTGEPLLDPVVAALGVDGEGLRGVLRAYLVRVWSQEPVADWDAVLTVAVELSGGYSPDLVTAGPATDHLNLDVYVEMLARLIARESTRVPLSVGLFGEWGSGKSYFMKLVRDKIDELAARAGTTAEGPYHGVILQIGFNAWHYADTDLWSSLALEIFDQLADTLADDTDPVGRQRAILRARRAQEETARAALETTYLLAEQKAEGLRTELSAVAAEDQETPARGAELWRAVADDPGIRDQATAAAERLGLSGGVDAVLQFAGQVGEMSSDVVATRRVLGQKPLRRLFAVLVAVTVVIALVTAVARNWTALATATATVVAFLGSAGAVAGRGAWLVRTLRGIADAASSARERIDAERTDEARRRRMELTGQLAAAEHAEALVENQRRDAAKRIAGLDRELDALRPERRVSAYLEERRTSADYLAKLGTVSLVRRDFEKLVSLMKEWKEDYTAKKDHTDAVGRRPIDRIVLYIDDLDRCEPDKVVVVLQAVHLLLAIDLFVVVVGVDPRWLLRSLSRRYRRILGTTPTADERDAGFSASTPQNYLEKIFQVPFVLPGMDPDGFTGLLTHLARPKAPTDRPPAAVSAAGTGSTEPPRADVADHAGSAPAHPDPDPPGPAAGSESAATPSDPAPSGADEHPPGPAADLARDPGRARVTVERRSEIAGAQATPITDTELALLSRLAPLVRTPRTATRLVNVYGLLRSTRDLTTGGQFLDRPGRPGDHQAVAQLLGILIAAPELFGALLWGRQAEGSAVTRGLCRPNPASTWAAFVDALEPERTGETWHNGVVDAMSLDEVRAWRVLRACLGDVRRSVTLDDIARYREWAPKIARFSFLMSPFTADEPDAASAVGAEPGPG